MLLDPKDSSEEREKQKGQQVSLAAKAGSPFPFPAQLCTLQFLTGALVSFEAAFQLGSLLLRQCLPQDQMWKQDPTSLDLCAHGIIQLSIHL